MPESSVFEHEGRRSPFSGRASVSSGSRRGTAGTRR
jgi:hypothetical protein